MGSVLFPDMQSSNSILPTVAVENLYMVILRIILKNDQTRPNIRNLYWLFV